MPFTRSGLDRVHFAVLRLVIKLIDDGILSDLQMRLGAAFPD